MSLPPVLRAEINVRRARMEGGLSGSGVYIVNPPWQLDAELAMLLPELCEILKQDETASSHVE